VSAALLRVLGLGMALGFPAMATAADAGPIDFNASSRTGREIYERFRAGLAEPGCPADGSRWTKQFAHAPAKLASPNDQTLALFGHVVDSVRAAHLPTEYALIPFVESGYKPSARSPAGPAGLWQLIGSTARNHKVPMRPGYDGRMSAVDSTKAAVRYLKTLHGMFGGNWRLAVMAYNAGEYRVFGALKRAGVAARNAQANSLTGLPDITRAYDDKLHAISCVMAQAEDRPQWLAALDRQVPRLAPVATADTMIAMTPARDARPQASGTAAVASLMPSVIAPDSAAASVARSATAAGADAVAAPVATATSAPRRHTVAAGESLWRIARQYRVSVTDLLNINRLDPTRLLAPGMVLAIDAALPAGLK
jgi:membrane-bound lytic murein transglycosylase D